jgi:hypothetical protein
MSKRITLDILLFLSILFAPWWVSVLLSLFLLVYFDNFIEIIIAGIVMDTLYGNNWKIYFIVGSSSVFVLAYLIKRKMRF